MKSKVRWGIIAPGYIAHKFATGLRAVEKGEVYAVCSRKLENARSFIAEFGGEKVYDSEDAFVQDPEIDVVYIANPHPFHVSSALKCLNAGKAVLCEKPMTVCAADTAVLIAAAQKNNVFLMEAMWTRFLPVMYKVRELLASGVIGEVRLVSADFGFNPGSYDPESRLLAPELAGGALLDVGIYPLAFCSMVLGKPSRVQSAAYLGKTGVDEQFSAVLEYGNGVMANIMGAVQTQTSQNAWIYGTEGSIKISSPWWCGTELSLFRVDKTADTDPVNFGAEERLVFPYESNGYNCEAAAVSDLILAGKKECEIMPQAESLELAETMDIARKQWGLKYPFE